MPSIQVSLDALDAMIANQASVPQIRSQIDYITREVAALEADYMRALNDHSMLRQEHAKLQQAQSDLDQEAAEKNRHKVGVTLKNGKSVYYDADAYALLPNSASPKTIEFRKNSKTQHTYEEVAHVNWADVSELHKPTAL
jgi:hypothetical protein